MSNLELFVQLITAVIILMIVSQLSGRLMVYFKQPRVIGEMIAGVLLGPTLFGLLLPDLSSKIFNSNVMPLLFILGNLGLSFYMFLVGAEIDLKLFTKKTVKEAGALSIAGVATPFVLGVVAAIMFYDILSNKTVSIYSFSFYMGTALSITAFPMLARILQEKKLIKTKIGVLSLISASIQDVVAWILLAFITSMAVHNNIVMGLTAFFGGIIFVLLVFFIVKPFLTKIGNISEKEGSLSQAHFSIVMLLLLSAALTTDKLGLYSVFGGFILGLAIPRTKVFEQDLHRKLNDITAVFLLPIFFTFSGLNTNLTVLKELSIFLPCLVIILFSFFGKYLGCALTMKAIGFSWRESSAIGALINARGLMELILANIGLSYGIINRDMFSILVLMAIVSTLCAMPLYYLSMGKTKPEETWPDKEEFISMGEATSL